MNAFMSSTRREDRPTFIRRKTSFLGAEEKLRLTEESENGHAVAMGVMEIVLCRQIYVMSLRSLKEKFNGDGEAQHSV